MTAIFSNPNVDTNRVLLWAESQMGGGHMQVVARLARELQKKGIEVTIASSRANEDFNFGNATRYELPGYIDSNSDKTTNGLTHYEDEAWQLERKECLEKLYDEKKFGAVVVESWPLSLSPLHDKELTGLVDMANQHGADVYSISRDIVSTREAVTDEERARKGMWGGDIASLEGLLRDNDINIIVRGDGILHRLEETREGCKSFNDKTFYAGYFIKSPKLGQDLTYSKDRDVVVSSGGYGSFAYDAKEFFETAIKARKHSGKLADNPWHIYVPLKEGHPELDAIRELAASEDPTGHITVQPNDSSFAKRRNDSLMAIIRGGYTAVEAASEKLPFVIVPKKASDQQLRADKFSSEGVAGVAYTSRCAEDMDFDADTSPEGWGKIIEETFEKRYEMPSLRIIAGGGERAAENIIIPKLQQLEKKKYPVKSSHASIVSQQRPISAVLLDWDGVMVNPNRVTKQAWEDAMQMMEDEGHKKYHDWTIKDKSVKAPYLPLDFFSALYDSKTLGQKAYDFMMNRFEELIPTMEVVEGSKDTLRYLHKANIPVAIVSNSPRHIVEQEYDALFDNEYPNLTIVGSDNDTPIKPSPSMLFEALETLGIDANKQVMMFGDGYRTDIQAGRLAGISPVLIKTPSSRDPKDEEGIVDVVHSHEELRDTVKEKLRGVTVSIKGG